MKIIFFVFVFAMLFFQGNVVSAQQPYPESEYERRYKMLLQQQQQQQQQTNQLNPYSSSYPPDFDRKTGERIVEGFVYDIKEVKNVVSEFKIQTKLWGDLKIKMKSTTNITPSRVSFKEGEYVIIRQHRSKYAVSIDIPAVWDAKKRALWFDSTIRK